MSLKQKETNQPENPITSFILFLERLNVIFIIILYSLCMCVFSFHLCGSVYSQILIFLCHSEKNYNEILFVQMKNVLLLPLCEVTKGKATQSYNPTCCFCGEDFFWARFEFGTKQEKDRWGRSEWAGIGKKENFLLATGRRRSASQLHASGLHQLYQGRLTQCLLSQPTEKLKLLFQFPSSC